MKAAAQEAVVVPFRGTASNHLVDQSTMVKMCDNLLDTSSSGPTKSMWKWRNLLARMGMGYTGAAGCTVTLPCWQGWHCLHKRPMSAAVDHQAMLCAAA